MTSSTTTPNDEAMEPYWALAEELDLPVGIHVGTGPPGAIYRLRALDRIAGDSR